MKLLKLEPAAVGAALAAVYAAVVMAVRAYQGDGVLDWDLLVAAGAAVWGLWTRTRVTPMERPRTAEGYPRHGPQAPGEVTPPSA